MKKFSFAIFCAVCALSACAVDLSDLIAPPPQPPATEPVNPDDVMLRRPESQSRADMEARARAAVAAAEALEREKAAKAAAEAEAKAKAEEEAKAEAEALEREKAAKAKAEAEAKAKAEAEAKAKAEAEALEREKAAKVSAEAEAKAKAEAEAKAEPVSEEKKAEKELKKEKKSKKEKNASVRTGRDAVITSERTDYDRKEGIILFDRNVHVDDEQYQMHADQLFVFLDGTNDLKRIVAIGNVAITNEGRTASCSRAVFTKAASKIVMYGDDSSYAKLSDPSQHGGMAKGKIITFWLDAEQVEVVGSVVELPGGMLKGKDPKKLLEQGK